MVGSLYVRRSGMAGAFLALLAVVLLTGCGGSGGSGGTVSITVPSTAAPSSSGSTATTGSTATAKQTPPGVHAPAKAPVAAPAGTGTTSSTAAASSTTDAAPAPSGHLLRSFTGSGSGRLGTLVVSVPSVLSWHAQRGPIQIFTSSGFLLVQSAASHGSVRLSQGTYRGVRVASRAGWSIELRTRAS